MAAAGCCRCPFAAAAASAPETSRSACPRGGSSLLQRVSLSSGHGVLHSRRPRGSVSCSAVGVRAEVDKAVEKPPRSGKSGTKSAKRELAPKGPLVERTEDPMGWREYRPKLDGDEKDFWEGAQWNGFGFFLEYLWAFGIVFAAGASLYAIRSYNDGATDFKETDAFKAALESARESPQELADYPVDDAPPL